MNAVTFFELIDEARDDRDPRGSSAEWITGKGADAVAQALSDPDGLIEFIDEAEDEFDNEELEYAALEVLDEREIEDPRDLAGVDVDGQPWGEIFDEDTVFDEFPRLAARG